MSYSEKAEQVVADIQREAEASYKAKDVAIARIAHRFRAVLEECANASLERSGDVSTAAEVARTAVQGKIQELLQREIELKKKANPRASTSRPKGAKRRTPRHWSETEEGG